jgi:hypothetical protein
MGNNHDPVTLHKYLYANADPGNMVDPSGNFSLGSLGTALNVVGTLTNIASTAYDVFSISMDDDGLTAKDAGSLLLSMLSPRILSKAFKAFKHCNSFDSETLVSTKDGLIPIAEIKIGDLVWAFDEETGARSLQEVTHLIRGEGEKLLVEIELENKEIITATNGHPFFNPELKKWVYADQLEEGSQLLDQNGDTLKVSVVRKYKETAYVYNLTVNNDHTYYVSKSGVLSHNANVCNIPVGVVRGGNNFKDHFIRHKNLLSALTGKNYKKYKTHGQEFLDDIQKIINDGKVKYVGQGTLKKGQGSLHIYRGNGVTLAVKDSNEFVTLLRSGEGMDVAIKMLK